MIKTIIVILVLASTTSFAQQLQIVSEEIPPLQMLNSDNQPTGAMVEIVEAMLEQAKFTANIKFYPWARSYQLGLSEKNTIIFSLFRDKERESKFQWIGKLYALNSYITTLKSRSDIEIDSIAKAKSYTVGTIRGDLAESYLLEQGFLLNRNLFVSSKYDVLWELLYTGRIDAAFTNAILWRYELESLGLDAEQLQLNFQVPNFASDLYIAASLTTDKAIVTSLIKALAKMKSDGSYQAILAKWRI
jgi:polar amino acid transport system substrate-binding protein